MRLQALFLAISYFLCIYMEFRRFLVLCGSCLFFSTYGVSFSPLEMGHRATRVFDSG